MIEKVSRYLLVQGPKTKQSPSMCDTECVEKYVTRKWEKQRVRTNFSFCLVEQYDGL